MARRFKSASLRALIVTLLGVLIRHATLIVPDVGDTQQQQQQWPTPPTSQSTPDSKGSSRSGGSGSRQQQQASGATSSGQQQQQQQTPPVVDGLIGVLVDILKDSNVKVSKTFRSEIMFH